ncbi:hypothetical protein NMY22_g9762 [Coprinellus aureogranulatus]|nr:hypothetical protein NMY22_g9762 [Coprinellus aureogranulatus]
MELDPDFKLSSDLVAQILGFLDPVDILAMRAVSLHAFTALTVCELHGIFKPTYPLDKMSRAELESAASGPHRFMRFVSQFESEPQPHKKPLLTRRFSPGGRRQGQGLLTACTTLTDSSGDF